ncbi:hypothetical protein [Streptomyces sp. PSAA01]|uniref:hypothetical protein n=1 Tax=Streptomyces sp. PSAA01 TaxID=2912762 RepID=UPI001F3B4A80|nr:hypothetical protein [Streptomyces sp. PSAA01]MCG0284517.1 hypothetical protein [Streptomyces sp. PSAA01]
MRQAFGQFQYPTPPLSRSGDGIHDLLDIETARATADTLATLAADRAAGGGTSGPAARRAIPAAGEAPAFEGIVFTARPAGS